MIARARRWSTGVWLLAPLAVPVALHGSSASANTGFPDAIPNGAVNSCLTCHLQAAGGEGWNDFGKDMLEAGGANPDANPDDENLGYAPVGEPQPWSDLCDTDSDGDGYSNGEELADPTCTWVAGDDDPSGDVTNPGDGDDFPAGDGGNGGLCAATSVGEGVPAALLLVVGLAGLMRRRCPVRSRRS